MATVEAPSKLDTIIKNAHENSTPFEVVNGGYRL